MRWLVEAALLLSLSSFAACFILPRHMSRDVRPGVELWAGPGKNVFGSKSGGGQGGAFGRYGRDDRRRRRKAPQAEPSKDPNKRVAMLSKKLNSIVEVRQPCHAHD